MFLIMFFLKKTSFFKKRGQMQILNMQKNADSDTRKNADIEMHKKTENSFRVDPRNKIPCDSAWLIKS